MVHIRHRKTNIKTASSVISFTKLTFLQRTNFLLQLLAAMMSHSDTYRMQLLLGRWKSATPSSLSKRIFTPPPAAEVELVLWEYFLHRECKMTEVEVLYLTLKETFTQNKYSDIKQSPGEVKQFTNHCWGFCWIEVIFDIFQNLG